MTGERLKHILYAAGISQTELAEKLGTTQQNLHGALKAQDINQQKVDEANRKVLDYVLGGG